MAMNPRPKPRVLIVEDDEDSREMLLAFLSTEGYESVGATTAEEGLERLRSGGFGMVITDHRLPGKTGAWLLHEAGEQGLLRNVGALLWSADPDPRCRENIKVLKKPVDLDRVLLEIEATLAGGHRLELERRQSRPAIPADDGAGATDVILYVTDSLTSLRALRNLQSALADSDSSAAHVTICDLSKNPLGGVEDRVAFTPILIRRAPKPRESLLGDLRRPEEIHRLLQGAASNDKR